ncbi:MAG: hypothetical protein HY918_06030 [Candidatus Doudnabacteria bacterium]|nr:hypothetical protein [Candidatus Doudnabacteria bacterium]
MGRKITAAVWQGSISAIVLWLVFYLATPSTVWPLFGVPGVFIFICWIIAAVIDAFIEDDYDTHITKAAIFPIGAAVLYIGSFILGSGLFRADEYQHMIGSLETRVWTQDVQPKDPKHMRMSTRENAIYLAKKALGEAGAIGSQFVISEDHMTLQMINGELWYVAPLDFSGFSVWLNTKATPGYIMVHGEDPHRQPILKILLSDQQFRYMPEACFGNNLERHLRNNGYLGKGLAEYQFEIDDNQRPWWVVSTFEPTIMWSGKKVTGVAIVDPVSGDINFKRMGEIPDWIDRAIPSNYVKNYLDWWGEYTHGWLNSWWGTKDLTKPEDPNLIYASDQQPDWVTGLTSRNDKDDSLVSLVYTNSRTGKTVLYKTKGGGTDQAVLDAISKNQDVQYKKLHGVDPQLYNVYGIMSSVVPLLSENHAYQGVAIVDITNIQTVATGRNQFEALRAYQKLLSQFGQQVALDKTRDLQTIEGTVDRVKPDLLTTGAVYYVHLKGVPHLFTGGSADFHKLPVTEPGDKVKIEYFASGEDIVPMHNFDNLSLPLEVTKAQTEVTERSTQRRDKEEAQNEARTVTEEIKQMSPEQLRELGKKIRQPKK